MSAFHLQIVTPDGSFFDGEAERVIVRAIDGDICILPRHIPYVTALAMGEARVTVDGKVRRAAANGDATCLDLFHLPRMHAFSGQLTAIVQSGAESGNLVFEAKAKGVKAGKLTLEVK